MKTLENHEAVEFFDNIKDKNCGFNYYVQLKPHWFFSKGENKGESILFFNTLKEFKSALPIHHTEKIFVKSFVTYGTKEICSITFDEIFLTAQEKHPYIKTKDLIKLEFSSELIYGYYEGDEYTENKIHVVINKYHD